MKVPLEWLRQYVRLPGDLPSVDLAQRLTMAGSEVVGIEQTAGGEVLDLEITPNRPDCLSVIGVAREVAAITHQRLKLPTFGVRKRPPQFRTPHSALRIQIEDRTGCRRYIGRLLEGVKIGPSPEWMQRRLRACGFRPINNVVDITNYVLLEWGQPLHAFDANALQKGTVVIRRARPGETLVTLDVVPRILEPEMLIIADANRPVAIAGVMGGLDTQVTNLTKRVILESAYFEPLTIRRTARRLGLASESSYRFERGVDPAGVERASQHASQLIQELAGGVERAVESAGKSRQASASIVLGQGRLNSRLGVEIPPQVVANSLRSLGCAVRRSAGGWRVQAPSFRRDIRQDVDLIEEVARVWRYERLPSSIPAASLLAEPSAASPYARAHTLRTTCAGLGLSEVITWALVSESELAKLGVSERAVSLANPLSRDHAVLRPTLVGGLLQVAARNLAQGASGVRCFELGKVFEPSREDRGGVREELRLGLLLAGSWEHSWQGTQANDLFRLKGIVEQLAGRLAPTPSGLRAEPVGVRWAQPGRSMRVWAGPQRLGDIGQVARRVCDAYDCAAPVWIAELEAGVLLGAQREDGQATVPSAFPPVKRDVSFLVDRSVAYAEVATLIRSVGSPLAVGVSLIDRYTGPTVQPTKHSLTFAVEYRDPSRTLTAEEVDRLHQRIIHALTERFRIQLR
ncbi:MAG: phenylalanine--tRNA ligase subunit beta [Candidatus Omnitrophica bacterium]|nr:phenylalanine--tRNA ligase subunit beta [Candidatus Omnitrophota bacterium]